MRQDTHDELAPAAEDGIASYLLGLSTVDIELFEEHLTTCKICRQEVKRLKPIIADLVFTADRAEPPPGLRERVLALTTQEPSLPEDFAVPVAAAERQINRQSADVSNKSQSYIGSFPSEI